LNLQIQQLCGTTLQSDENSHGPRPASAANPPAADANALYLASLVAFHTFIYTVYFLYFGFSSGIVNKYDDDDDDDVNDGAVDRWDRQTEGHWTFV